MVKNDLQEKIWDMLQDNTKTLSRVETHVATIDGEVKNTKKDIEELRIATLARIEKIKEDYVTLERFKPTERIAMFAAGTIGGGIILIVGRQLLHLVIK